MTNELPELPELVERVRRVVPQVEGIWVFGSQARGDAGEASDVDLGILTPAPMDPVNRFECELALGNAFGRDVDLIDLARAPTVLRKVIVTEGKLIWASNRSTCDRFAAESLSMYAALNEERAGILADFFDGRAPDG